MGITQPHTLGQPLWHPISHACLCVQVRFWTTIHRDGQLKTRIWMP
nr:MAG TPA: hypothetical protein [Caudoviricetes sp.]